MLGVDRHQRGAGAGPRGRHAGRRRPTRLSLLASATGTPRSSAASVGRRPAAPTRAFSTRSGSAASISAARSGSCGTVPPPAAHAVWRDAVGRGLGVHLGQAPAAGEAAGLQIAGRPDHLEGLDPDGSGGPQHEYACHRASVARRPRTPTEARRGPAGVPSWSVLILIAVAFVAGVVTALSPCVLPPSRSSWRARRAGARAGSRASPRASWRRSCCSRSRSPWRSATWA